MKVLLIEGDPATSDRLALIFTNEKMNVYATDLGEEGVDLAKLYDHDLIVLDLKLPDMSGMEALRQMRASKVHTPVLILAHRNEIEVKVQALSLGADDYVVKPFDTSELVARMRSIVRRSKGHARSVIQCGALEVDLTANEARAHGRLIHLTGREFGILSLLALRKNDTVRKDTVMNHLYGGMDEPEMKIVDVFVCKLRAKLKRAGVEHIVHTTWGIGYRLVDPVPQAA